MMHGLDEIERARTALFACDAGCSRDQWLRIGMAAKAAGVAFDDFRLWSEEAPNYHSEQDCLSAWKSFGDGAVKAATLYHAARKAGWHDPTKPQQNGTQAARVPLLSPTSNPKPPAAQAPRIALSAVFDSYPSAPKEHPYIAAKRGVPDGLRVVPPDSQLVINGKSVAGYLAVPVRSLDGELLTVQYIPPGGGDKLNAPGASFDDGVFVIGDISADGRLYVCEGIGQAWAVARADYHAAAVVTFGAGRFRRVAEMLRTRLPRASLVFIADRGKEPQAEAIVREVGGTWVELQADKPTNYDCNDFEADHGSEALAELLQAAKTTPLRYQLQSIADLMNAPPPRWLVRGVLPADGLAALYGPSGSGKSFLAFDLCAAIAEGRNWFGRRVSAAPVTYVCLEGEAGFGKRAKAWSIYHQRGLPKQMRVITQQQIDLRLPSDIADLSAAVLAGGAHDGLLVIDTLNRAAPGADENSSKDMGELIGGAKELQRRTGGVVLLVHHTGKDGAKGMRGHSSLYAALDAAIEVSRSGDRREWSIAKSKDDEDGARACFRLNVLEVDEDEDGEPVSSCVIQADNSERAVQQIKLPQGSNQKIAHEAMGMLLRKTTDFGNGGAPTGRPCVALDAAIDVAAARMPCAVDSRRYIAKRAVTAMVGNGIYVVQDGWLWRA